MKVLFVLGTRPEVIKLAPVIFAAKAAGLTVSVCATGQHREMQKQALATFGIVPDDDLDIMESNQTLARLTENLMREVTNIIIKVKPDWVIVQGDTTTAMVGSLAAFYQHVNVGHVEAGLRTYNLESPFPEELNRQLIGRIAKAHFPPTKASALNLKQEGTVAGKIVITGNTVVDAIAYISKRWQQQLPSMPAMLSTLLADKNRRIVFITCHRRESFGTPLLGICRAIKTLCEKYPAYTFIYPVHPNPNVRDTVHQQLNNIPNLQLIEPLDYESTLYLLSRASLVISDSGGIQEESPSFFVPTVVMRNHTERQEGIDAGFAMLSGADADSIIRDASQYLDSPSIVETLKKKPNPYGDGKASDRIINTLSVKEVEPFYG